MVGDVCVAVPRILVFKTTTTTVAMTTGATTTTTTVVLLNHLHSKNSGLSGRFKLECKVSALLPPFS